MMAGGDAFPTTALHRSCPSLLQALLPLPSSFLLTVRDTRPFPSGTHTCSTLSATIPADPLGLSKPRP
jgi:hypothetical protein